MSNGFRRRQLLVALGAMGVARVSTGQPSSSSQRKILGILNLLSQADAERLVVGTLRNELRKLGWVEGENLVLEGAYADNREERLPALAADLVRRRPDAIWVSAGSAIAAARSTQAIPIVFFSVAWPVETGLIKAFHRPGGNVTGVALYAGLEVSTKRLEFLREVAPDAQRLSWILDAHMGETVDGKRFDLIPLIESAARGVGYEVKFHFIQSTKDVDVVFEEILAWRAQALMVGASVHTYNARNRIAEFALRHHLPSASVMEEFVSAGGLLSYHAKDTMITNIARSAQYVDRIFRGARPVDLPVERPSRYELMLNLKTAKATGIKIPSSLLVRADRVIE
jgi:putative ABC transport system substrate-binding protein